MPSRSEASPAVTLAEPRIEVTAEAELEFYRRKQDVVAVPHSSGDQLWLRLSR